MEGGGEAGREGEGGTSAGDDIRLGQEADSNE